MFDPGWLPELLAAVLASVIAITLHEAAHGYAALGLGDPTAREAGRLSLNPLRHVDRVGTILVPGVLLLGQLLTLGRVEFMFGWAKPVPVDVTRLRHPLQGMMLVAAAGPAMNFFLAWLAAVLLHVTWLLGDFGSGDSVGWGYRFLALSILANLVLGLFNLLPIPPLDGGRILAGLLPVRLALGFLQLERYGILIVLFVVFLLPRLMPGYDPVGWTLRHVVAGAFDLVLRLAGHGA
ncbi:site-2 protease family protein [Siccirubricoccus sp. KC 17139]|uniref:Site-2 protease family protein n=1 Tax=Siccirubricoccus soli TaxID=2899147 RepID=A0ABT1D4C3_9PROT|nr:site-2 protease family protein [Siccirubricoccus soli]MCO6416782.1 site-2 protease family protein [Siccirubricoccus soli]MCP2682917.1 site-2 protease family protein [Siccirubricoccus soli]